MVLCHILAPQRCTALHQVQPACTLINMPLPKNVSNTGQNRIHECCSKCLRTTAVQVGCSASSRLSYKCPIVWNPAPGPSLDHRKQGLLHAMHSDKTAASFATPPPRLTRLPD